MGLPSEIGRQNEEWERTHPKPRTPHYYTQEELTRVKPIHVYDHFTTSIMIDGKGIELQVRPANDDPLYNGFPTLYGIDVGRSFAWLHYKNFKWFWSHNHPQDLADFIGEIVIVAWYQ